MNLNIFEVFYTSRSSVYAKPLNPRMYVKILISAVSKMFGSMWTPCHSSKISKEISVKMKKKK